MSRTTAPARHIKHTSIQIGDTIKVERQIMDATVTHIGKVAKRERSTYGTDYLTTGGIVLYTHTRDELTTGKITLLHREHNITEMGLF